MEGASMIAHREALAKSTGIGSGELVQVLHAKGWVP
jgi:hypothetical protein